MDAHLDILSDELFQVNTRVSCIARQQACLGGFAASPEALANEDDDGGANDDEEDEDASSFSDEEMTTSQ